MGPYTSTREQFTSHLTSKAVPPSAAEEWRKVVEPLKLLLEKLAHHSAMAPNLQQTYMTPANSKNRIYFMWDFVGRTLGYLYMVDPSLRNLSSGEKETWQDAQGRALFSSMLILDEMPGALNQMTEQAYPGQRGQHPEFGDEILEMEIAATLGVIRYKVGGTLPAARA